jgi:hypothetical protein
MGVAAIAAVIEAIVKVAGWIKGIYDFVKFADDFLNGRNEWDQVRAVISAQIVSRNQILQVSAEILDAVAQLDRRLFLANIADQLGDSDQAVLAFDTWKRTDSADQKAIALNESADALADILRYSTQNVYPNESLVFPLIEILMVRLVILKEADPDFVRSSIGRQPILEAAQIINSTTDNIERAIREANEIRDGSAITTRVTVRPQDEGGGREVVQVLRLDVSYRNLDGSVAFERRGEFEPEDGDFNDIINQAKADAAAAQQRGLAADLERARVTVLREAANTAERSLLIAEARWVATRFFNREPTEVEIAYFVATRLRASFDEVAASFFESAELDPDTLWNLATELSGQQIEGETEESLRHVAGVFGRRAVLGMLLRDGTPDDQPDPVTEPPGRREGRHTSPAEARSG